MEYKQAQYQQLLQRMSLTPQMRQSIQILSLSAKDLNEYIDSAISANPFLQKVLDRMESEKYKKAPSPPSDAGPSYEYEKGPKDDVNPRLNLLSQIRMLGLKGKALEIAEYLIYELDDNGYLMTELDEVADNTSSTIEEVQKSLEAIQSLDPPGIGGRDIGECLQLQLKRNHKENSLEYKIVTEFLNEVARNDIENIAKALNVDKEKVLNAINNIKKLNPKPASSMLSKELEKIVPDLIVRVENKKIRLELNRGSTPRLKLYNPYENELDIIKDPEARKFLKENMDYAKTLIDNLKRREETICSVANYILNFQQDTLNGGGREIKSLTISNVAEALDFHPSTISRAISNKYIQLNDKVIPLKRFLSHGIKKENGEITSKTAVKDRIERLVKSEDGSCPLSDSMLKEGLEKEGIKIDRRTVAKYRHALRILPAYLRKKVTLLR